MNQKNDFYHFTSHKASTKSWILEGNLFTNLSHDEPENVDIYFDDFTLTHEHGSIVQVQDYYPYGLTFNENIKANAFLNKYLTRGRKRWTLWAGRTSMPGCITRRWTGFYL